MAHELRRAWSIVLVFSGALAVACRSDTAAGGAWRTPTPRPIVSITAPLTPNGPTVPQALPVASSTQAAQSSSPTATALALQSYVLYGVVYDAAADADARLIDARLTWHFAARVLQSFDGEMPVDENGAYRLPLSMRPEDEIAITAFAPGYQPSSIRLRGSKIGQGGAQLNFGLYYAARSVPTMPGDLGIVEVRGIVYNAARGVQAGIDRARLTITHSTVVRPAAPIDVTTSPSGTFAIPIELHTSDQLDFTIGADGFITTTVSRRANDLIEQPQLQIALQPAP